MAVRRASFSRKFRYYVGGLRYYLWLCWKLLPIATVLACALLAVVVIGIAESVAELLIPSRRAKRDVMRRYVPPACPVDE
jgi:hypothetical protein